MRLALHIFRKDSRQFRIPIAVMLAWTALFAWSAAQPWPDASLLVPEVYRRAMWPRQLNNLSMFVFPVAWAFLIAQVVHAESLVGERQFWLTRPYHRGSLAAAKALFLFAYIIVPLTVAQGAIVVFSGLPLARFAGGLIWEQLLITLLVLLPAAAMAALTSRLYQFILLTLVAVPLALAFRGGQSPWGGLDWIRSSLFVSAAASVALIVLVLQFWRRRTSLSRLVALVGALSSLIVVPFVSYPLAFSVQAQVQQRWQGQVSAELVRGLALGAWAGPSRGLQLEFRLRGLPDGAAIMCRGNEIGIHTATGVTRNRALSVTRTSPRAETSCHTGLPLPAGFLESAGDVPATIEATLYVTVLSPERLVEVPADYVPAAVPGGAVCVARVNQLNTSDGYRDFTGIECRTAFRDSSTLVQWQTSSAPTLAGLSLSPWPAALRLAPVGSENEALPGALAAVPLTIREPIAHIRTVARAENIRLRDFEVAR